MAGPFLTRDFELAVKEETAYGTDPTLSAASFFKHKVGFGFTRKIARYDRDQDADAALADVLTTHKGRESSEWEIACDLIPSGSAVTPTAPDIGEMLLGLFGASRTATAHTTTAGVPTTTILPLATGGLVASGLGIGDIVVVDVSSTYGLEARQIVDVDVDEITLDRALSAAPAAGRAVHGGVTYNLSQSQSKSLRMHCWAGGGDNVRYAMPGAIVQSGTITIDGAQDAPVAGVSLKGIGGAVVAHTLARPTPTTAGVPLIPTASKVWIGASAAAKVVKAELALQNILDLRQNDIASLVPTGVKRTANGSRYQHTMMLDMLLETGTIEGYYSGHGALTAYDVIVQLGTTPGAIVVWRAKKWVPETPLSEIDGEIGIAASGRLYGTTGDDSIYLAFL